LFKAKVHKKQRNPTKQGGFQLKKKKIEILVHISIVLPALLRSGTFRDVRGIGKMVLIGQTKPKLYVILRRRMFVQSKSA